MMAQRRLAGLRTSRPGHGKIRVDPARMVRYAQRTLSAPPARYVATRQELDALEAWGRDLAMGRDLGPTPAFVQWRDDVEHYCRTKGLRLGMFVEDDWATSGRIITWEGIPQ